MYLSAGFSGAVTNLPSGRHASLRIPRGVSLYFFLTCMAPLALYDSAYAPSGETVWNVVREMVTVVTWKRERSREREIGELDSSNKNDVKVTNTGEL